MGTLSGMSFWRTLAGIPAADTAPTTPDVSAAAGLVIPQLASPFAPSPSGLASIVWADLVGSPGPLTRAAAMGLPAIARQRHLIAGTIARLPLNVMDGDTVVPAHPGHWTVNTGEFIRTPFHRMLSSVDDLLFYGWSIWTTRTDPTTGRRVPGAHLIRDRWEVDAAGRLLVDGELVDEADVIAIPGPHEGILTFGATAITQALSNARAAANAANNPSAYLELHYTGTEPLTDTQIDDLIARWSSARRGENGGVAYTGPNIEVKEHGSHESALLIDGRNADAVDMSRLVSSPAAMADATIAGGSLTYETTDGRNGQFIDYGLALYLSAIEARLSSDDVVDPGLRVAFDTSVIRDLGAPTTGAPVPD